MTVAARVRVLIYEPYPMGKIGGNLRTLFYMTKLIERARFELVVVTPARTDFIDQLERDGVRCIVLAPPDSVNRYAQQALRTGAARKLRSAWDLARYNFQIAGLLRRERADVLYCNSIRAVLFAGFGAKIARVPVLWYIKGALEHGPLDRLGFLLSDRILFFCGANRDDRYPRLVRWFRKRIGVLRIGIDPAVVEEAERDDNGYIDGELGLDPATVSIVVLGQVYRPKGVHFALDALRDVVRVHPNVKLYIVGDSVLEEFRAYGDELRAQVARDGLADHVVFTGWRRDAMRLLTRVDIVLHPSLAEGFGRAVLEAMAMGRAVVASRVGGLREAIKDGENGYLVDVGDTRTMSDRLTALVGDRTLRERLGQAARREIFTNYLIADKMRELETIWLSMAGRPA